MEIRTFYFDPNNPRMMSNYPLEGYKAFTWCPNEYSIEYALKSLVDRYDPEIHGILDVVTMEDLLDEQEAAMPSFTRIMYFNPENPKQVTHLQLIGYKAIIWDDDLLESEVAEILVEKFDAEEHTGEVIHLADLLDDEDDCEICADEWCKGFGSGVLITVVIAFLLWIGFPQFIVRHVVIEPVRYAYFHAWTTGNPDVHFGDEIFLDRNKEVMDGYTADEIRVFGKTEKTIWTTALLRYLGARMSLEDGEYIVLDKGQDRFSGKVVVYVTKRSMLEGTYDAPTTTPVPTDLPFIENPTTTPEVSTPLTADPPALTDRIKVIQVENWSSGSDVDLYDIRNSDGSEVRGIKLHINKEGTFDSLGQWVHYSKLEAHTDHYDLTVSELESQEPVQEVDGKNFMRVCNSLMDEPIRVYRDFGTDTYTIEDSRGNLYHGNFSILWNGRGVHYNEVIDINMCHVSGAMGIS